jgi:hypothetical protein
MFYPDIVSSENDKNNNNMKVVNSNENDDGNDNGNDNGSPGANLDY